MDFNLTQDQQMLWDTLDRFLTDRHSLQQRAGLLVDPVAEQALWKDMAELGLIGAAFPERAGGLAASSADVAVVMDRLGRHLVTQPYLFTAVLCGRLLLDGGPPDRVADLTGDIIAGDLHLALAACARNVLHSPEKTSFDASSDGHGWKLSGRMPVVLNADRADRLLVAARTSGSSGERDGVTLFLVDAHDAGLSRRAFRTIDQFGAAEVTLDGVVIGSEAILGEIDCAVPLIEIALDHAASAVCCEAVGAMDYLVPATAEYTRTRVQYDAPLSQFQVLQHRMADMYIQTQTAKSMALVAAMALDGEPDVRRRMVSAAKAQVGRSGKFVGYQAVQLHGGMGVTEELDIGHHYIRLHMIARLFGDSAHHLARFDALARAKAA